jgi:hypothetical protein
MTEIFRNGQSQGPFVKIRESSLTEDVEAGSIGEEHGASQKRGSFWPATSTQVVLLKPTPGNRQR